jgi:tetratricopeptide (TPR) repeat protein
MNGTPTNGDAVLAQINATSTKIKNCRSIINEKWAVPADVGPNFDEQITSLLDRVTDGIADIADADAYAAHAEGNYERATDICSHAWGDVLKSTSAALDKIGNAARDEADSRLRFHTIRKGDFREALDARSEANSYLREAQKAYEQDKEEAIELYQKAIDKFDEAATAGSRGGIGRLSMLLNLVGALGFALAVINMTPLGDLIKTWIRHLFGATP